MCVRQLIWRAFPIENHGGLEIDTRFPVFVFFCCSAFFPCTEVPLRLSCLFEGTLFGLAFARKGDPDLIFPIPFNQLEVSHLLDNATRMKAPDHLILVTRTTMDSWRMPRAISHTRVKRSRFARETICRAPRLLKGVPTNQRALARTTPWSEQSATPLVVCCSTV